MDVDIIMSWPLDKLYEYMAFYMLEDEKCKDKLQEESLTQDQKNEKMMQLLMRA